MRRSCLCKAGTPLASWSLLSLVLPWIVLASGLTAAAETEAPPKALPPRAVSSASRRFLVTGLDSAAAVSLAVAAEEAAARLEAILRRPIPFARNQPVVFSARRDEKAGRGLVVKGQGWTDRGLAQKLEIVNAEQVDQEDLLEALSWLLANRYLAARQTSAQRRTRLAETPEWLSVGLAQNLYPSLRARNARLSLKQWLDGHPMAVPEILSFQYLPGGRWSEKAFCGVLTDWLLSSPAGLQVWDRLVETLAAHARITAPGLAEILLGRDDPRELEKHWELWLAHQMQIRRMGEASENDPVKELEAQLIIRPEEWPELENLELPETLTLAQLIEYRDEKWMSDVAWRLEMGIRHLGLGRDKAFQRVLDSYGAFVAALSSRKSPGFFGWFRRPRSQETALRTRLEAAGQSLEQYRTLRKKRARFVDEAEWALAGKAPETGDMLRRIPRSQLQRYVDAAEGNLPL
jgi:hypothetical protein